MNTHKLQRLPERPGAAMSLCNDSLTDSSFQLGTLAFCAVEAGARLPGPRARLTAMHCTQAKSPAVRRSYPLVDVRVNHRFVTGQNNRRGRSDRFMCC